MQKEDQLLNKKFQVNNEEVDEEVNYNSYKELDSNVFGKKSSVIIDAFVAHYKKRNKHNRTLRILFFSLSFFFLFTLIGSLASFFIIVALMGEINVEAVISIIGAYGTILTAIIVLPKIVGKNLFPETEDKEILGFVKEMNKTELEFDKMKKDKN